MILYLTHHLLVSRIKVLIYFDLYVRYYYDCKSNLVLIDEKKINHDFIKNIFEI